MTYDKLAINPGMKGCDAFQSVLSIVRAVSSIALSTVICFRAQSSGAPRKSSAVLIPRRRFNSSARQGASHGRPARLRSRDQSSCLNPDDKAFGRVADLGAWTVENEIGLKRVLADAIQNLRLTFSDATFAIMRWLDVAPPVARTPPQCPARAAAG